MSIYSVTLAIHSWTRWLVLILAVVAIFKALTGWVGGKDFTKSDNAIGGAFIGTLHLQLALGFTLYFIFSPFGLKALQDNGMGGVMKDGYTRYWAVEHVIIMILAVVVAQVGRSLSKKAKTATIKHQRAFVYFTIALVLILSRIPWNESLRMFRGL